MAMHLGDPTTFRQVFEAHERGVHAAAMRILGNAAQAQDVGADLAATRRPGRLPAGLAAPTRRIRLGLTKLRQDCPDLALDAA